MGTDIAKKERTATTLETLAREDSELRARLEKSFEDDEKFIALIKRMIGYLEKTGSPYEIGIERARYFAAAEVAIKEMATTERGKLSNEFIDISNKREIAEEEVQKLRHAASE